MRVITSEPVSTEFTVMTVEEAQECIEHHGAGPKLWEAFWSHMAEQIAAGAPANYVIQSHRRLGNCWEAYVKLHGICEVTA